MKKTKCYIAIACLLACPVWGSYTYEVYTYVGSKNLSGTESIFIDQQGGMPELTLVSQSSADVLGTSDLVEALGGIWLINIANDSSLYMSGGQVHEIAMGGDATAFLSGGLIQQIWSEQIVIPYTGPTGEPYLSQHITIVYSGDLPTIQTIQGLPHLVGVWGNGTDFSIYLPNIEGYSPAIENIRFELIPEPTTLLLLGLGGVLIRRKK